HPLWTDSAVFLFGAAMLLFAASRAMLVTAFRGSRALAALALILMVAATAYNLYIALRLFGGGLPIVSLLLAAFGGYLVDEQWALLQDLRLSANPSRTTAEQ